MKDLLFDRIDKYKNLEKGPLRTFKKILTNTQTLYACPNNICIFKTVTSDSGEDILPLNSSDFKPIEKGDEYTIVQLKDNFKIL